MFCVEYKYIVVNAVSDFICYCVTVHLKCTRRYRNLHGDFGGLIAHRFFAYFIASRHNRCGAYTPVMPDNVCNCVNYIIDYVHLYNIPG